MNIDTVNVIEIKGEYDVRVMSFSEDKDGNAEAEAAFVSCIKENSTIAVDEIDVCIEEGVFEDNGYKLLLVHSD